MVPLTCSSLESNGLVNFITCIPSPFTYIGTQKLTKYPLDKLDLVCIILNNGHVYINALTLNALTSTLFPYENDSILIILHMYVRL